MRQRSSGGGRRTTTGGTDGHSLHAALVASSLLLWLPYSLAAVYVAYCSSFITEVPLISSTAAAAHVTSGSSASASHAFASASSSLSSTSSAPSAFGVPDAAAVVAMGVVAGNESLTATALRRYSAFYYYIFPADFDIAVFVPLLLRVLVFSAVAVSVTFYLSVYRHNGGEYLMAVAWALGACSGYGWLTSSTGFVQPVWASTGSGRAVLVSADPPSWLWLVVSLLTGLFSGILCKVKDIVDGKHDRDTHLFHVFDRKHGAVTATRVKTSARQSGGDSAALSDDADDAQSSASATSSSAAAAAARRHRHRQAYAANSHHLGSLGDRLYMVVPFCTGRWFAFILHHGWRGIVVENGTILLSLSLVGYTMLSYKFLKRQVLRASGRVTRSVAARGRSRRNERRLREQQQQRQQGTPAPADGTAAGVAVSDEETEEEITDFFEDVGEVAFIDVIDLISKLFTTSFGVVVLCVIGINIFMTSLCIPFLKALFKLNALVSGVGIVIELIMYEVA